VKLQVDNDFQQKVMTQRFDGAAILTGAADVAAWRAGWMAALSSWHSPYKLLVDCGSLTVGPDPDVAKGLDLMVRFFNGFFLRKVVGYNKREGQGHHLLPFPVLETEEEAAVELGIRQPATRAPTDFRSLIQLQNHFQQHSIELSFAAPVMLATKEQVTTLRSKLTNNLMQWHSKWNLIVDCANLEVAAEAVPELERMLVVLRGFFMKQAVGYSPKGAKETYPFPVYRARHKAVAEIEAEGAFSGDKAECKSKKA
jgi:hypothetical protein